MNTETICVFCKGTKKLCGANFCPKLKKLYYETDLTKNIKESVFGPSPPNMFVGSYGWPQVNWGPMVALETIDDNPSQWYGKSYYEIIKQRSLLITGRKKAHIKERNDKNLKEAQDAIMSIKTLDMEINFKRKPSFNLNFSSITQPMGGYAPLKDFKVVDNPKIPKKVDSIVEEKKMLAQDAIFELNEYGLDEYYLTKLFSGGLLGHQERKKLVPLRWSITAMDDMLAKQKIEKIKYFDSISNYYVCSSEYLDNHYEVLLMPGSWEFENFESWAPGTLWSEGASNVFITEEYEPYTGRKKYADKQVGGYYASRYGVCESLNEIRKQARVLAIREIYEGYQIPVGVWQVREGVKHAIKNRKKFSTLQEALDDMNSRLRVSIKKYEAQSKILKQKRLFDF
ncbi:Nre family DNA repair protein [Candidatus Micrarchaeota archaeon]|nr:Nre family DNA repair protein [Candidatus Micrarchaeota archaeon]